MKKIYILFFVLIPIIGISQNATISGVVSYFFNENIGDKPDIGAKVYILDSIQNPKFDYDLYKNFHNAQFYKSLYNSYLAIKAQNDELLNIYGNKKRYAIQKESAMKQKVDIQKDLDDYFAKMTEYGVETNTKFEVLDKKTFESYYPMINDKDNENVMLKTIGATGDYSFSIKPSTYYIFIVSKNRTGHNMSDIMGKIYCKKIIIKEGQSKDVSNNFEVN